MRKNALLVLAGAILIAAALGAGAYAAYRASAPARIYRVAVVSRVGVVTYRDAVASFRGKMAALGYAEGKNVSYDIRYYRDASDLPGVVEGAVGARPDVMITYSTPATAEAYKETKDRASPIPVVFGSVADPVAAGVVKSVALPGTNVTGVSSLAAELTANRLRLLKEINPSLKTVAFPHSDASLHDAAADKSVTIAQDTARGLGISLLLIPVASIEDNAAAAQKITARAANGLIVGGDSLVWSGIDAYIAQAIKEKIPFAAFDTSQIAKGALIGIGPDYRRLGEQTAAIANQILRGTPPSAIPVQVPDKLVLAINLATARAIGVTIPSDLLARADLIIGK